MNQNGKRVHAATQHQYWSDSSDGEDDDKLRVLDMRMFQGSTKSSYLSSKQEVKAQNGYVWCQLTGTLTLQAELNLSLTIGFI